MDNEQQKYTQSSLLYEIENIKKGFYETHSKHSYFTKTQKNECATIISNKCSLTELLKQTIFCIPNTNRIFFEYIIYKQYACKENYMQILSFGDQIMKTVLQKYGNYEFHVNLNTFTITAFERYFSVIHYYLTNYAHVYSRCVDIHVYNTPNLVNQMHKALKPFMSVMTANIHYHNKDDSNELIMQLMSNS